MTVTPVDAGTSAPTAAIEGLLTADTLAVRWKVSPRTVRKLAAAGQLRGTLIGRSWRFSAEQVAAFEHRGDIAS